MLPLVQNTLFKLKCCYYCYIDKLTTGESLIYFDYRPPYHNNILFIVAKIYYSCVIYYVQLSQSICRGISPNYANNFIKLLRSKTAILSLELVDNIWFEPSMRPRNRSIFALASISFITLNWSETGSIKKKHYFYTPRLCKPKLNSVLVYIDRFDVVTDRQIYWA